MQRPHLKQRKAFFCFSVSVLTLALDSPKAISAIFISFLVVAYTDNCDFLVGEHKNGKFINLHPPEHTGCGLWDVYTKVVSTLPAWPAPAWGSHSETHSAKSWAQNRAPHFSLKFSLAHKASFRNALRADQWAIATEMLLTPQHTNVLFLSFILGTWERVMTSPAQCQLSQKHLGDTDNSEHTGHPHKWSPECSTAWFLIPLTCLLHGWLRYEYRSSSLTPRSYLSLWWS